MAAAKLRQAERFLDVAQSYGSATQVLADRVGIPEDTEVKKSLILGVTTDRGLCGGVNSQLVKEMILQFNAATAEGKDVEVRRILFRIHLSVWCGGLRRSRLQLGARRGALVGIRGPSRKEVPWCRPVDGGGGSFRFMMATRR